MVESAKYEKIVRGILTPHLDELQAQLVADGMSSDDTIKVRSSIVKVVHAFGNSLGNQTKAEDNIIALIESDPNLGSSYENGVFVRVSEGIVPLGDPNGLAGKCLIAAADDLHKVLAPRLLNREKDKTKRDLSIITALHQVMRQSAEKRIIRKLKKR